MTVMCTFIDNVIWIQRRKRFFAFFFFCWGGNFPFLPVFRHIVHMVYQASFPGCLKFEIIIKKGRSTDTYISMASRRKGYFRTIFIAEQKLIGGHIPYIQFKLKHWVPYYSSVADAGFLEGGFCCNIARRARPKNSRPRPFLFKTTPFFERF